VHAVLHALAGGDSEKKPKDAGIEAVGSAIEFP